MDLSIIDINLPNLNATGFDAVQFSVIGMGVVFGGLTLIAVYITLLPIILHGFTRLKHRWQRPCPKHQTDASHKGTLDDETLVAVATALHLYQFSADDNRKITWKRHDFWDSSWQRAGRFEAMNNQGHTLAPRR